MEKLGIAIIGGGPAGLAAGIYAARGGASVKLFEEMFPGGQIVKTHRVENYPGLTGGPDGYALAAALEKHAAEFDLPVVYGSVSDLKLTEKEKTFTAGGEGYAADAVILCMGAGPRKLGHPAEDRFVGAGVSYCATCDGNFYRGKDVAIVATGFMVHLALEAKEILAAEGINATVINIHTVKPIDKDLLVKAAKTSGAIVTAEEHSVIGGLGAAVCEAVSETYPVPVVRIGIEDRFGKSGQVPELLEEYGLTAKNIADGARRAIALKR